MATSSKDVVKLLNHLKFMIQLTRQLLPGWSVQPPCASKMPLYHFCSKNASQVRPTRAVCTDFAASVQMGSIQCWHLHDNQENSRDVFLKDSPGLATNGLSLSLCFSVGPISVSIDQEIQGIAFSVWRRGFKPTGFAAPRCWTRGGWLPYVSHMGMG